MEIIHEENPTPGLTYQILEPAIHRFHITDMTRDTVDATVDRAMAIDTSCDKAQTHACFLYILDGVSFTPYLLHRVMEAVRHTPPALRESSAVVGDNLTLRLLRSLIMPRVSLKARQSTQFFAEEASAREWLAKRIAALAEMD